MPKPKRADGDRYMKRTAGVFSHNLTKVVESKKLFVFGPQEVLREALRQSHQIGLTSGTGMMDLTRATTMIGLTRATGMVDLISGVGILESLHGFLISVFKRI